MASLHVTLKHISYSKVKIITPPPKRVTFNAAGCRVSDAFPFHRHPSE